MMLKSLKVANYKNIGNFFIGFDNIEKLNILIGQNNIGKSILLSILDKLEYILAHKLENFDSDVKLEFTIQVDTIPYSVFASSNPIANFDSHKDYGESLKNKSITYEIDITNNDHICCIKTLDQKSCTFEKSAINSEINILLEDLGRYDLKEFINNYKIIKLNADRNLLPEKKDSILEIKPDGRGATNFIRAYLHNKKYNSDIVEKNILEALNEIVFPNEHFEKIKCQEIDDNDSSQWEIILVNNNGKIQLSNSGSGLKTILLVLIKLFLETESSRKNIFVFEELENNLHPAIQRNLFNYLYKWADQKEDLFFITTHSNIPINMFGNMPSISITHLKKDRDTKELITESAFSFSSNSDILNDLGVKASDILQSNGIIWVEGPSDRVYINKWIELASGGILRENIHYQILFYGGRLLSHLTGETKCKEPSELINLFLANRNSILVMDSDKRTEKSHINETKRKIRKEFIESQSIAWITKGREIENYLSQSVINKEYGINKQIEPYEYIGDFLNKYRKNAKYGDKYIRSKYQKSTDIVKHMCKDDLKVLDLEEKIGQIVQKIKDWNYIK